MYVKRQVAGLCPVFDIRVMLRISSYSWNKEQQRFITSNLTLSLE